MRTYCSLVICSDTDQRLKSTVKRILGLICSEFVDNHTPERLARVARLNSILKRSVYSPPRYVWNLSSREDIESVDAGDHISWLLSQVRPGQSIQEINKHGSSAYLTCFWAGNGRGGGPVISSELTQALANHGVELQFDFYVEDKDAMGADSQSSWQKSHPTPHSR